MTTIIGLAIILVIVYRGLTPDERLRCFKYALDKLQTVRGYGQRELEPFWTELRERTPRIMVTPALVGLNVALFVCMLFGTGSLSAPATLVGWGASIGPRTSGGEWWRLLTAVFVHGSFIALVVDAAALFQLGLLLERLVGAFAFAATFASAALAGELVLLWMTPIGVSYGPAGALWGLFGLLLVLVLRGFLAGQRTIPLLALVRLAPITLLVFMVDAWSGTAGAVAALVACATGIAFGVAAIGNVQAELPRPRPIAVALAVAAVATIVAAAPMRGTIDVRPEIQRLVDIEQRTSAAYDGVLEVYKNKRRQDVDVLVRVIETSIVPELQAADERLKSLRGVPSDDRPLVADAREYLRLRTESWTLRARGLRESNAPVRPVANTSFAAQASARHRATARTLGQAEATAHTALDVLARIKA